MLISYENEAILARQNGEDFDYIIPDETLLIENPAAVTVDADPKAKAYLDFVLSEAGQTGVRLGGLPTRSSTVSTPVRSRVPTTRPIPSRPSPSC